MSIATPPEYRAHAEAARLERAAAQADRADAGTCPGCGRGFQGPAGLRAHRSARFSAMGCRA